MALDDIPPTLLAVAAVYAVMSAATFAAYGLDKWFARCRKPRINETTLHLLALLGGWPGALLAMSIFRHKRQKTSFVLIVWLVAFAHAAGWVWWVG